MQRLLLPLAVLINHVVADYVTHIYGAKDGSTTVRVKDKFTSDVTAVLRFYALYQFSALSSHLIPNEKLVDLGFNTLIAIQSSAFLMTLYRKSLITSAQHGFWYSFCIFISFFHIIRLCGSTAFYIKLSLAYVARTKFALNKYLLWVLFAFFSAPDVQDALVQALEPLISAFLAGSY
jgi:hypothetical protein